MLEAPRILIVEDNPIQSAAAVNALQSLFPQSRVNLIETEHDFRTQLPELASNPPDLVVMDILLGWCNFSDNMPEHPEDVVREGYYARA